MTSDSSLFIKRIRHLSQALIISGALNIGVLSMLLYWMLKESPPTPYCELKPASFEQQQIPLADQRGFTEVLNQLSQLSFSQLVSRLSNDQLIENGYAERDLALACLIAFHHFDIQRALPKNAQPQQQRLLAWKPKDQTTSITLAVYPDLNTPQFDSLIQFAKTERWPLTAEGLFLLLKDQKGKNILNDSLVDTFVLTAEFWTVELLFNRSGADNKQDILTVLLEGNWNLLKQFVDQQRQIHDSSDARRQKFLLDYLKAGSPSATLLLLKAEWEFSVKKLDDQQVIVILKSMPADLPESTRFAKEMLTSPRSTNVWRQASQWLYTQAGEAMPKPWNHQAALMRFVPEKPTIELVSKELVAKPSVSSSTLSSSLPLTRPKVNITAPTKSIAAAQPKPVAVSSVAKTAKTAPSAPIAVKSIGETKKVVLPPPVVKVRTYLVQEKDSLWKISRRFEVKVEDIKTLNQLKSDTLKPGTVLKIP